MPEAEVAQLAREWFAQARDDLMAAEKMVNAEGFKPRHVCWQAQQAAEKAIKALLVCEQIRFPFTHDLEALTALTPPGSRVRDAGLDLETLTQWAIEARYLGGRHPTQGEARAAVDTAASTVSSIESDLRERGIE